MSEKSVLGGAGGVTAVAAVIAAGAIGYYFMTREDVPEGGVAVPAMTQPAEQNSQPGNPPGSEDAAKVVATPEPTGEPVAESVTDAATDAGLSKQAAAEATDPEDTNAPLPETTEASSLKSPSFDHVRVDEDGRAVISGTAPSGFDVSIEVDGADLETVSAGGSGEFAAFVQLPVSKAAQVIFLVARGEDGQELRSDDSVILAPRPATQAESVGVAEAEATDEGTGEADLTETTADAGTDDTLDLAVMEPGQADTPGTEPELELDAVAELGEGDGRIPADADTPMGADADMPIATADTELDVDVAADDAEPEPTPSPSEDLAVDESELMAEVVGARPGQALAPTVLLAGRDGVELLQPANAVPERLRNQVMVDVISYADDGSVALEGRAAANLDKADRVRVYLNNKPVQTGRIEPDGRWRLRLPPVKPGVYTLRVDQVDQTGRVVARFETPFQREDPAELARLVPPNGRDEEVSASVITVQPGYTLWGIASDRYGDGLEYVQIFEANRVQIRDPDLIYPGQVFELPEDMQEGAADTALD